MQSLDAGQLTRARGAVAKAVTMVKLTLYSDRKNGVVDATYYLAENALRYDYGNTGTNQDFLPFLLGVSDLVASMRHLPDENQDDGFERRCSITLSNDFYPGGMPASGAAGRLIETLRGPSRTRRLIGAGVEIAELLIDEWAEPPGPINLTAFTGAEHTVRFRGVVDRLGPIDEQSIGLACVSQRPRMIPWARALDPAGTPPAFLGRRLPMPYGRTFVPCIPVDVGAVSTVAAALATTGGVELTDASRFPSSGTTTIQIGREQITYTGKTGNALTGVTRGANSTTAVAHAAGEVVQEVQTSNVWAIAGGFSEQGLPDLFVRNPFNEEIVRVKGSLLPTYNGTNRSAVAGFDCATITFTNTQLKAVLDELGQSSRVTQQPVVSHPVRSSVQQQGIAASHGNFIDGNESTTVGVNDTTSFYVQFAQPNGTTVSQIVRVVVVDTAHSSVSVKESTSTSGGNVIGTIATDATGVFTFETTGTGNYIRFENALGTNCDIADVTRTVTYDVDNPSLATAATIEAQSLGYDLEFFADTNGLTVPQSPTASPCHGFNSGSWSGTNCTPTLDTAIKVEGASSLKIAIDESHTTLREACDSTTGWGGGATLSADTAWKTQGTGSIKGTSASSSATNIISPTFGATVDLTGPSSIRKIVALDFLANLSEGDRIAVVLRSNSGTRTSGWFIAGSAIPNGEARTIFIDYSVTADFTSGGGVDPTVWSSLEVTFNNINGATSKTINVDNIRTLNAYCLASISGLSNQDFNANSAHYQFSLRGNQADRLRNIFIDFANTGGLAGGNHRRLNVAQTERLRDREWRKWRGVLATIIGSDPTLASITEIQVTVQFQTPAMLHGAYPWDGGINLTVWVDAIHGRDDTQNPYQVSVGGILQWGNDAMRHWIAEAGEVYDEGAGDTDLAFTRVALDMASTTDGDWGVGLAELGRHVRANIVPVEASTGTQWKQLSAKQDYSFPAATVTLTEFDTRTEAERGLEDLATRFVALIDRDIRIEDGGEAQYVETLVASPGRHDLVTPSRADLEAREAQYGQIDSPALFFPGLPGSRLSVNEHLGGSKLTVGYYARERSRIADARTIRFDGVPWYDMSGSAWGIELGDIFEHSLPWDSAAIDLRVIEVQRSLATRQVNIIAVEVPTT